MKDPYAVLVSVPREQFLSDSILHTRKLPPLEKELQPIAPFRGQWERDDQHEAMLRMHSGGYKISIGFPWCDGKILERWLVETLWLWPHPNAPVSPDETDYPNYRNRCYAKLHGESKCSTDSGDG